jgi:hypothetical protein
MSPNHFKTSNSATIGLAKTFEQLAIDMRKAAAGDFSSINPTAELHYWFLGLRSVPILLSSSAGHPLLGNKDIHTSQLFFIDPDVGLARTFSRWYRLGARGELQSASSTSAH